MKWKVVPAFKGTPARVNTPPPARELVIQSPTFAAGTLANRSPSILKPPAGEMTGAMPAGGGDARPGWFPKTRKETRTRENEILTRPTGGASFAFKGIVLKVSIDGEGSLERMGCLIF